MLDQARRDVHKAAMVPRFLALLLLVCLPSTVAAQPATIALEQADMRLAQVAERLQTANAPLCRQLMPVTGLVLHSADQFGQPAPARFGNGEVAVALVLPGSPAEAAQVARDDGLTAIAGQPIPPAEPGYPMRDSAFALLAAQPPSGPVLLTMMRRDVGSEITVRATPGCRVLVEVLTDRRNTARSDGRVLQVSQDMVARLSDEDLAVVVAHELAHVALEHRRRLSEAGVEQGLLGEFGRNRRLRRQVEEEADRLSVHLLANAGYDPVIGARFWRSDAGRRTSSGLLRSGAYASREERAAMMAAEASAQLVGSALPSLAPHLLGRRDQPFASRDD